MSCPSSHPKCYISSKKFYLDQKLKASLWINQHWRFHSFVLSGFEAWRGRWELGDSGAGHSDQFESKQRLGSCVYLSVQCVWFWPVWQGGWKSRLMFVAPADLCPLMTVARVVLGSSQHDSAPEWNLAALQGQGLVLRGMTGEKGKAPKVSWPEKEPCVQSAIFQP